MESNPLTNSPSPPPSSAASDSADKTTPPRVPFSTLLFCSIGILSPLLIAAIASPPLVAALILFAFALGFLYFTIHYRHLHALHRAAHAHEQRTRQILQLAIDALPHPAAFLSPDGHIEIANTSAQTFFSLKPGLTIHQLPRPWLTRLLQAVTKTHTRVEPTGHDAAIQVFNQGREYFFLPRAIPLLTPPPANELAGITLVLVDTTDLRHIDEAKSGLLSSLSHELKTPLTSIQMSIHLLLEDAASRLTPRQLDLLEAAREDADRLNSLIATLLATPPP